MSQDIIISQSFMKAMNKGMEPGELTPKDYPKCPTKAKAIYLDGYESKPTKAMMKGNFFETLVYGGTESGEKPVMERLANGAKSTEQLRVESQAMKFKTKLKRHHKMDLKRPREHIIIRLMEGLVFRARIDVVTSFLDENGEFFEEVILDTKITDSLLSTYGEYSSWGAPESMDHLQAVSYSWAYEKKYGVRVPFWYCVLDVSPQERHRFIGGLVTDLQITEFKEALRRTVATMLKYNKQGHWPLVPSEDNCKNCPLKTTCTAYTIGSDIHRIW